MCYNFCVQLVGQLNARKIGLTLAAYRCSASVSSGGGASIAIDNGIGISINININISIGNDVSLSTYAACRSEANQGKITSSQLHN